MSIDTNRVEELFFTAQQIASADDRLAWLETACAGDTALRSRVEALLSAAAEASQFLNKPAVELADAAEVTLGFDSSSIAQSPVRPLQKSEELSFLQPTSRPDSLGRLGHFEVLEVIGQGGFGIVLRAFDEKLHRVVALKVLAPELAANGSARKRFVREARTAAAVKNEHVVSIYGVEENAQPPYLAMEMIDGKSLQDKIDQQGPLSLTEILRIGSQMAEGLAAAHKQGLVHRDIKPANILLENGVERVKITDFGLARAVDDASVTQSGTVAGTPMYMSPEQAEGLAIDHRSDLFSLGTVLYAMCTGHSAFRGSGTHAVLKRVIEASPRPIREVNQDVPEWLCAIIAKLHAKPPGERFQTANEVAELLGQHLAHLQQPNHRPLPAPVKVPSAKAQMETKDEPDGGAVLSGMTLLLSTIRTLFVYWVVIGLLLAVFGQIFGWHWRTIVRGGCAFFGVLALAVFVQAIWTNGAKRPAWVRALSQAALSIGSLAFGLGLVATFDWFSPIPDPLNVKANPAQHALRGKWVLISGEANGEALPKEFLSAVNIEFDDAFRLKIGDFFECQSPIVLDGAASPKTIMGSDTRKPGDGFKATWSGDADQVQTTASSLLQRYWLHSKLSGIYAVEGSQLKLCIAQGGYAPPKRFDSRTDDGAIHGALNLVLVRAPDDRLPWNPPGASPVSHSEPNGAEWISLFNGRDLEGWEATAAQDWRVENGVIHGTGASSYLFSKAGEFEDFHLLAVYRINKDGDSGIRFRSRAADVLPSGRQMFRFVGFEAELSVREQAAYRDGALTYKSDTHQILAESSIPPHQPYDWTQVEIIAQQERIQIVVNGRLVTDFIDKERKYRTGRIGLTSFQSGGYKTEVEYRRVEIRRLPSGPQRAIAPFTAEQAQTRQKEWAEHLDVPVEIPNSASMKLRLIPPGEYLMGTAEAPLRQLVERVQGADAEKTMRGLKEEIGQRRIFVSEPFYLSACEVTVGQFRRFVEATKYVTDGERSGNGGWSHRDAQWKRHKEHVWKTPGPWKQTDDLPVVHVSHRDATAFVQWLSNEEGRQYVLPTRAQWEFAARAGTTGLFGASDDPTTFVPLGWGNNNLPNDRPSQPQPVGTKEPNPFGLFDMQGNVWEWTNTWRPTNQLLCGGGWYCDDDRTRPAAVATADPTIAFDAGTGFRVALVGNLKDQASRKPARFVSLFNGKDLTGWLRSPKPMGEWTVKDGILEARTTFRDYLYTERGDYRNFHLLVEAKINSGGDGGLLFRCEHGLSSEFGTTVGYEAEINTLPGVPRGSLRTGPKGPNNTVLARLKATRPGEWFTQEVIVQEGNIVVKIDGEEVLNHTMEKENYSSGHVALQVWGEQTELSFRKVEIKELPRATANWTPLFNGKDLVGWSREPGKTGWKAQYGRLSGSGDAGFLTSDKEYGDFHLRARVKISPDGDSGIYFRCQPDPTHPRGVLTGYEAQVIGPGSERNRTGSIYRFLAGQTQDVEMREESLVVADQWFDYEIIAEQGHIRLKVNGATAANYTDPEPYAKGRIALDLYEGRGSVEFERIEIKELFPEL